MSAPLKTVAVTALAQKTTLTVLRIMPGTIGWLTAYNPDAVVSYIQMFDAQFATITLGTTAPTAVFPLAAASVLPIAEINLAFVNGCVIACTTTATGSTAPTTGLDITFGLST